MECIHEVRNKLIAQYDALFQHAHRLPNHPASDEVLLDLKILRAILMELHLVQQFGFHFCQGRDIGSIISKFDLKKMDFYMALELIDGIRDILHRASWGRFKDMFESWARPPREYFPRTGQHRYVDHLREYLEQVMKVKADRDGNDSIGPLKFHIVELQPMLQMVSGCLVEIPEQRKEDVDLKVLVKEISDLAYELEYCIDLFLSRDISMWYSVIWLHYIQIDLKNKTHQLSAGSGDVESIIREIREGDSKTPKIIPIMIDNKINEKFDEIWKVVADDFDICTWSMFSTYKKMKKQVFLQLLRNVSVSSKCYYVKGYIDSTLNESDMIEDELTEFIKGRFRVRKNFVILKDVVDIEDFDDIRRILPDLNDRGSRILLSTHSPELMTYCHNGFQKSITIISEDHTATSHTNMVTTEGDVVGFKVETDLMLERLTGEPKQLHIISIAGMAGQGKTTFANKLYNHPSIVSYFDKRAWCSVSQIYEKKEILLKMLDQVVQLSDTVRQSNDDYELAAMLCKSLRGRRFLIVLDDIWSTEAWNDLRQCFPDDKNGSRIIFTTRLQELASQAQSRSVLQTLARLSDDESWTLLHNKIFQKEQETCPPELLGVGANIAKHCKGLPLSIVLTAGLLKKMEKRQDVWNDIADNLSLRIFNDADAENKGVIDLSYKHLPDSLKPCFLYLGAFLEDREVPVQKLIRLWIAEGFIKHSDSKILEEVADDYLKDLISRSLVTVAQEKSKGGAKTCRVHDLLREFALIKATEENFLQPIQGNEEHFQSCNDNLDYGLDPKFSCSSEPVRYYLRRVCLYSKRNHFFMLKPSGPPVRSLLFFAASDMCPSHSYDISFMFRNFKLLHILNFEDINIGNSFEEIGVLLHLRYLAVQGTMVSVPSSIANLLNLQTICIKSLENEVVKVPDSILNLEKLRHVHINDRASFDMDPDILEGSSFLDNLQTLSTLSLAHGDDMEKILRKLRGLRKLKCIFVDSRDDARSCDQFPVLDFLGKLESLKVFYNGKRQYSCQFNFPSNLKKLTLTNFGMPWNEILRLTSLENLEVLKLLGNAFEGETWEMEDEVFPKLKFLKLDSLNVAEWISPGDNFPCLERLILHKCEHLNEIPPSIGDIDTLLMIEVRWCSRSAAISTKVIQEMQSDVGNEEFKITVHPKIWDSE